MMTMKILIYDNGLNTELAVHLSHQGHKVAYNTPWANAFPKASQAWIGRGLEGLEVVPSFTEALERADIVVCPDTFSQDRVAQAKAAGKPTFGAGVSERLEQDRPFMKDLQKQLGFPVGPFEVIKGLDELIDYLRTHKDKWIKTSMWREMETFRHTTWEATLAQYLGPLIDKFGAASYAMTWLAEDPLKGVEIGFDRIFNHGRWVDPPSWGYEKKDEAYIGTVHEKMPDVLQTFCDKLEGTLAQNDCNSFVSNEVIIADRPYMIEPTIRCPHPPTAGLIEMLNPDIRQTDGRVHLKPTARFCAVLVIRSSWAGDHWLEVQIEPHFRQYVKLSQACKRGDKYFAVPGNEFVAYAVGIGNTIESAVKMCKATAEKVKCRDMDVNTSALNEIADEIIPNGRKKGIEF